MQSVQDVAREARWANAVGFDSLWVSQIFGVDPIVALSAVGSDVRDLKELGTSVVPLAGRHPLALAASARTAQSALDGRFTLGIGPSHAMVVEGFFGESYDRPFSRTREFVSALAPLLRGEPVDVIGEQLETHGWLTIDAAPCPILLAALGPRMLELAGQLTQGTTLGSCGPRTIATSIVPRINDAAARAGRARPRVLALVGIAVTDDPRSAYLEAVQQGELYASLPSYRAVLEQEGVESGADLLLAGSMAKIVEGLHRYVAAGVTELRLSIDSSDPKVQQATRDALEELLHPS